MAQTAKVFDRVQAFQRVTRSWRPATTVAERDFLYWFIDATVSYGRTALVATIPQMISGMRSKRTGEFWLPPICLSVRTLERVIAALVVKGIISKRKVTSRVTEFTINLDWSPDMGLAVGKKRAAAMAGEVNPGAKNDPENAICPANLAEQNANLPRQFGGPKPDSSIQPDSSRRATHSGGICAEDIPEMVRQKAKVRRETKADKDSRIVSLWKRSWVEADFGAIPPGLSRPDIGMLAKCRARLPADGEAFVQWSIINWRQIVAEHFAWMVNSPPPSLPQPRFLLGQIGTFMEAFASERRAGSVALMDAEEREYHTLRDSGLSHDDTMLEIGKRRAVGVERGKIARDQADIARQYRALELDRRAARREPVKGNTAPPPPEIVVDHGSNPYDNGGIDLGLFDITGEYE